MYDHVGRGWRLGYAVHNSMRLAIKHKADVWFDAVKHAGTLSHNMAQNVAPKQECGPELPTYPTVY
jgi:hypothetical protein